MKQGGTTYRGALFFVQSRSIASSQPPRIDLNADVGESHGAYTIGDDEAILASVTSASLAAGFHGGDPTVLRRTIALARAKGVRIGAQPGFPDLAGFGRRDMRLDPAEAEDLVLYQIAAVAESRARKACACRGEPTRADLAAKDAALAKAIAGAVKAFDPSSGAVWSPGSSLIEAGRRPGSA